MENTNVSQTTDAPKETAKDAFLHLLSAVTIYLSVIGFITLWWQIINFLAPDKLNPQGVGSGIYMTLIRGTSILAVAFPVHIFVSWIIGKDIKNYPQKREAGVRKWLWYITLFIAAITMIIDMAILLYDFLRGDLTLQFFLKSLTILLTAVAVFGYYLWDLKKKRKNRDIPKKAAWIMAAVILFSVILGFSLMGTPAKQRDIRFDEQRASDLQGIQNAVANYWQKKGILPQSLDELIVTGYVVGTDPETGENYGYKTTGDLSFEVCADFKTELTSEKIESGDYYRYSRAGLKTAPRDWIHAAARACFETTIDSDFFKENNELINEKIAPVPITD